MTDKTAHEREIDRFVTNWLWEAFEEQCLTPKQCVRGQMPSSCDECGWDSVKAFAEARAAAQRLEKRENDESMNRKNDDTK